jgi:hypothetical protein
MPDLTSRPELALARRRNRMAALFLDLTPGEARATLEGLRSSRKETDWTAHVVTCWHGLSSQMRASLEAGASDAALRRWASAIGRTQLRDFLRVAAARWIADGAIGEASPGAFVSAFRRGLRIAYRDPIALGDLAIDGSDLMDAGVPAGPALGSLLRRLLDVVLENPARNQRDELLALARSWSGGAAL